MAGSVASLQRCSLAWEKLAGVRSWQPLSLTLCYIHLEILRAPHFHFAPGPVTYIAVLAGLSLHLSPSGFSCHTQGSVFESFLHVRAYLDAQGYSPPSTLVPYSLFSIKQPEDPFELGVRIISPLLKPSSSPHRTRSRRQDQVLTGALRPFTVCILPFPH